jgi:hypothetical protein
MGASEDGFLDFLPQSPRMPPTGRSLRCGTMDTLMRHARTLASGASGGAGGGADGGADGTGARGLGMLGLCVQPVAGVHVRSALPLTLAVPPVPRRDRLRVGPQPPLGFPGRCFRGGQLLVLRRVLPVPPGPAIPDQLQVDVPLAQPDDTQRPPVPRRWRESKKLLKPAARVTVARSAGWQMVRCPILAAS